MARKSDVRQWEEQIVRMLKELVFDLEAGTISPNNATAMLARVVEYYIRNGASPMDDKLTKA